jgi:hypothetical protein
MRLASPRALVWALAALAAVAPLTVRGQVAPVAPMAAGQGAPSATGTGLILGQVVDGVSGKPVGGALVTLNVSSTTTVNGPTTGPAGLGRALPGGAPAPRGQAPNTQAPINMSTNVGRVLADGEGRFVFHDLPQGRANLTATAPGYTTGFYGAKRAGDASHAIVLTDGERFGEATIRVWKMSTISGTILDESGEPIVGVPVSALRFGMTNGQRRTSSGQTASTDDRGAYHFLVQAGDYLVAVAAGSSTTAQTSVTAFQQALSQPGGAQELMMSLNASGAPMLNGGGVPIGGMQYQPTGGMGRYAPPIDPSGPLLTYQTTYYPAAVSPSAAQTLTLAPGEDHSNVDITMRLVRTARVMGTVVGPDGAAGNIGLRLVPADSRDVNFNANSPTASAVSEPSGDFTFLGVPSGQYELQVTRTPRQIMQMNGPPAAPTAPVLWARMPVTVDAADVAGINVVLRTGVRITGRLDFDGSSPHPPSDRLATATISLQDLDGQSQGQMPTRIAADGQFTTLGVVPGHYLANVGGGWGPGWSLKSFMVNGHDLSASPQLLESDITGAVVTLTDHPNEVSGTIDAPAMGTTPDSPSVVVYFPANYQAWLAGGPSGRQSRQVGAPSGKFTVTGIPSGEYLFAAVPSDIVTNGWPDPKTVETIARGATRVSVGDEDHRTLELKPLTIR